MPLQFDSQTSYIRQLVSSKGGGEGNGLTLVLLSLYLGIHLNVLVIVVLLGRTQPLLVKTGRSSHRLLDGDRFQ